MSVMVMKNVMGRRSPSDTTVCAEHALAERPCPSALCSVSVALLMAGSGFDYRNSCSSKFTETYVLRCLISDLHREGNSTVSPDKSDRSNPYGRLFCIRGN